ncbi:MAG: restriction endonuclease subunit S [Cyanobacteria bacterium J06581_3]
MKDSGVEWIGEVPEHWNVLPLMRLTPDDRKIMYGIVLPGPDFPGGIPIVKGGDVKVDRLQRNLLSRTNPDIEARYVRSRLKKGDIVYSIRGGIGDAELIPEEIEGANITQDAARVSPLPSVERLWLLMILKSAPVFAQLEARALGATIRGINIFDLKRARIPVPPRNEQNEISTDLETKLGLFQQLTIEAQNAVFLLHERRSA